MPIGKQSPLDREANYAAVAPMFVEKFGRGPLLPHDRSASINDLIFMRMIDPEWSPTERALIDKSTAKAAAAMLCPGLRSPETLATIAMDTVQSPAELRRLLSPFADMDAVAKPAQASGGAVFVRNGMTDRELCDLYDLATSDYALVMREMQYAGLPQSVIVEERVPTTGMEPPDDFKFHCIYGKPLLCQIDHGRFGEQWSRVLRVPDFGPLYADDGLVAPPGLVFPKPDRMRAMADAAAALSGPFDYVRVDLYDGVDGIYFGEITFTPAASLGIAPSAAGCHRETATHREYSRTLMQAFHRRVPRSTG